MEIKNVNFPYPVLSNFNDDYLNVHFIAGSTGVLEKTKKYSVIKTNVEITDSEIEELLDQGKAKIIVKIYCKSTKYREIKEIKRGFDEIKLQNIDVNQNVDLSTFIVANEDLKHYCSPNFNQVFKENAFYIEKGSILAIGKIENLYIEKDINEFTKMNSVIKIVDSEKHNVPMSVQFDDEVIKIFLSTENYKIYSKYSKFCTPVINSMIIIPCLTFVLDKISSPDVDIEDYKEKKWYRVLSKKMTQLLGKEFKIEYLKNKDSLVLIQQLFDDILSEGLTMIEKNWYGGK